MWFKKKLTNIASEPLRIIFLDIDGVLNSKRSITKRYNKHNVLYTTLPDKMHIKHLNRITDTTGAVIVITSTWRHQCNFKYLSSLLYLSGVTGDIIDQTPIMKGYSRGVEIQTWLDRNEEPYNFVILDDDSDMHHLTNKLVKTDNKYGLTKKIANIVIDKLI